MRTLYSRFDKTKINELPKAQFGGRIIVIQSDAEAEKAVDYLLTQPILGFDTETRPSFTRGGRQNLVALLQVSTHDTCFLFRLNHIGLPECIIRLLSDNTVTKVGLSWHDDLRMLSHRASFAPGTFIELQEFVKQLGILDLSLQKLYANIFGMKISKSQRLSNWEADVFADGQKLYAATDAWACVMLYEEIARLHESGDYELEIVPEPENLQPVLTPEEKAARAERKRQKEAERRRRKRNSMRQRQAERMAKRAEALNPEAEEIAADHVDVVDEAPMTKTVKKPKRRYYPRKKKTTKKE